MSRGVGLRPPKHDSGGLRGATALAVASAGRQLTPGPRRSRPAPRQGGAVVQNSGPDPFEVSDAGTVLAYLKSAGSK